MKISVFARPVSNTIKQRDVNWPELFKLLTDPPIVLPDNRPETKARFGDYYTRGPMEGKGRSDDLLKECYLIILDIDHSIDNVKLPTPKEIYAALRPTGAAFAVHTSATPGRCRLVIPTQPYAPSDTDQRTWEAYCWCMELGLKFAFAGESKRKSQPWFLPQTTDLFNHHACGYEKGQFFDSTFCPSATIFKNVQSPPPPLPDSASNGSKDHTWFIQQLHSGTLHQAAISYAGFLRETTKWSPTQILDQITELVDRHAPSALQERWHAGERIGMEKWFAERGFLSGLELAEEGRISAQNIIENAEDAIVDKCPTPVDTNFPNVMSGGASRFAEIYSQYTEAPPQFMYMAYLTFLGNMLARSITIKNRITTQPRLFTLLIGETGSTRKSTAAKFARSVFAEDITGPSCRCITSIGSAEGLGQIFKKTSFENGGTGEPVNCIIAFDEFKAFTGKASQTGSTLLPAVTELFESNDWATHIKDRSIQINDACLSIIACCTIDTYESIYTSSFLDIGFVNRVFIVPGDGIKKLAIPGRASFDEFLEMQNEIKAIKDFVGDKLELELHPSAERKINDWYHILSDSFHTKRLEGYCLRLAILLAANERSKIITSEIADKAISLCDWQHKMRKFYETIDADDKITAMEQRVLKYIRNGDSTEGRLQNRAKVNKHGYWAYETAIKNLCNAKKIWIKNMTRGSHQVRTFYPCVDQE